MLNPTINERKSKFNKLFDSLNIKLIKGASNDIRYIVDYTNKGQNLIKRPIDLSNKNKYVAYCDELPF